VKPKTSHDLFEQVFVDAGHHSHISALISDWVELLLWFGFFDAQLKAALGNKEM